MKMAVQLPKILILALAYLLTGRLGLLVPFYGTHITLYWLPTGIAVAALLRWGYTCWPGLYAGALLTNMAIGSSLPLAAEIAIGNTLAPLFAVWLLNRLGFRMALDRQKDVPLLCLASAAGMIISAGNGVFVLWQAKILPTPGLVSAFSSWWMGDSVGVLLIAPLLLSANARTFGIFWKARGEFVVWALILAGSILAAVYLGLSGHALPMAFIPLPMIAWAALRLGVTGASLAALLLSTVAVLGTSTGHVTFHELSQHQALFVVWGYMVTLVVSGMMITALSAEQRSAEVALQESEKLFRRMLETSPIAVRIAKSGGHKVVFSNRQYCNLINTDSVIGRDPEAYYTDPAVYEAILERLERGEQVFDQQVELSVPDFGTKWARASYFPLKHEGEAAVLGWFYDVTEQKQLEERLHALLAEQHVILNSPLVGLAKVKERRIIWNNTAIEKLLGYNKDELIGLSTIQLYASRQSNDAVERNSHPELIAGKVYRSELEFIRKDGSHLWAESSGVMLDAAQGISLWSFVDITERKQAEDRLRLASLVYQNSSEAMLVTDENNNIVDINRSFTDLTGYSEQDVLGKNPKILSSGRQNAGFYKGMWNALNSSGRWQGELWNRRKNGETYPEWLTIDTILNEGGSVHRRVALFTDITEKKKTEEELLFHANYDQLTLLPNRRLFHDRLEQEIRKSHREKLHTALLFIDLDKFKDVNDSLGHDVGDKLLIEAAGRIKSCVRDYDTVARLGGDEFTVILSELHDTTDVGRIAQSIIDNLSQPFHLAGNESFISASIGIAICPDDGTASSELVKHADQALYVAKDEGRNRFSFFTESMRDASNARIQMGIDLRRAIFKGQLEVYYQPIVELATGQSNKAEALIRWRHPVLGFVSPTEFIPVAEDTGIILDVGDWVFLQAAQQVKKLRDNGMDFQISVNKSPVQFNSEAPDHNHWIEALGKMGLPGSAISVEITEGLLINNSVRVNDKLLKLRDAGIQVSIDDFGTGYSSLAYLKKFDIDYLKIDQSFTRNMAPESQELAICEAIVVMAHKLGIKVIAEGVETEQQRDLLRQIDCDYGQGYLFSRPAPSVAFEAWLSNHSECHTPTPLP